MVGGLARFVAWFLGSAFVVRLFLVFMVLFCLLGSVGRFCFSFLVLLGRSVF